MMPRFFARASVSGFFPKMRIAWFSALLVMAGVFLFPQPVQGQLKGSLDGTPIPVPEGRSPTDKVLYAFTPNDPYYNTNNPVGFPGQWHLNKQTSGAANDANLAGAWNRNLTGQGVTIGIVDDGLQHTHPDLNPNYVAADSFDFGQNDANPAPVHPNTFPGGNVTYGDSHGTSVAGVAAARGGNAIGGTGAAPNAGLAGLRVDFNSPTDQMFVDATLFHSSGGNTNIKVKNHSYGIGSPYTNDSAQVGAVLTSHNAGTIHVFAAGNERSGHGSNFIDVNGNDTFDPDLDHAIDGDANKKHAQNLRETIAVAALASSGIFASYSNWGANMWVTAPSSSFRPNELGITTTDRLGGANATGGYNFVAGIADPDVFPDLNYTSTFGGTSSSSPLVAGIMALGKQAQPKLNTRFAKHLLARTSTVVDPTDASTTGGWVTNGAGFKFNENYGFGLINADAFTLAATRNSGVTTLTSEAIGFTNISRAIPNNNQVGISETFALAGTDPLEEVEILLNIDHTFRGDVEAYLQSPSGTVSRLMMSNARDSFNKINWVFASNAFWGENPAGDWTLTVKDVLPTDTGTWVGYSVFANMGSLIPEPSSLVLAMFGFVALLAARRQRRLT